MLMDSLCYSWKLKARKFRKHIQYLFYINFSHARNHNKKYCKLQNNAEKCNAHQDLVCP